MKKIFLTLALALAAFSSMAQTISSPHIKRLAADKKNIKSEVSFLNGCSPSIENCVYHFLGSRHPDFSEEYDVLSTDLQSYEESSNYPKNFAFLAQNYVSASIVNYLNANQSQLLMAKFTGYAHMREAWDWDGVHSEGFIVADKKTGESIIFWVDAY